MAFSGGEGLRSTHRALPPACCIACLTPTRRGAACARRAAACRTPLAAGRPSSARLTGPFTSALPLLRYPFQYSRLDDQPQSIWLNSYKDDGGVPFGSARVSVDPACPLENLVLPFLTGGKSMDPLTILFFGDSLDAQASPLPHSAECSTSTCIPAHSKAHKTAPFTQMLDYVCMEYIRRGGDGWFAFLRNHNQVNYCHLPNGLTLIQARAHARSNPHGSATGG